jgi:LysR family nitrogen assimilation transcriptional regulator
MEFKQLRYFLCLAREQNMTRAASQLHIVQPALSMQIANLEAMVGKRLFDRSAHGMSLTSAGETFAELADGILREVDRAREEMTRLDGRISGRVSIGMIAGAATCTLAASSTKIAELYPEIQLQICEGYTDTLIDWVVSGQLDVAIINVPQRKIPLTIQPILDEEMVLAYGSQNSASLPRSVPFARIDKLDLVVPSRRHGLRTILDETAAEAGFALRPRLEVDTLSAVCEIVSATSMVTVLPSVALYSMLSSGRLRARLISRPVIARSIGWVAHPRRIVSAAASAVVKVIAADLTEAAKAATTLVRHKAA